MISARLSAIAVAIILPKFAGKSPYTRAGPGGEEKYGAVSKDGHCPHAVRSLFVLVSFPESWRKAVMQEKMPWISEQYGRFGLITFIRRVMRRYYRRYSNRLHSGTWR